MEKLNKEQLKQMQEILNETIAQRLAAMSEEDEIVVEKGNDEEVEEGDVLSGFLNSESFQELREACKKKEDDAEQESVSSRSSLDKLTDSIKGGVECFGELGEYVDDKLGGELPQAPVPRIPEKPAISFKTLGMVAGATLGLGFGLLEVLRDDLEDYLN